MRKWLILSVVGLKMRNDNGKLSRKIKNDSGETEKVRNSKIDLNLV